VKCRRDRGPPAPEFRILCLRFHLALLGSEQPIDNHLHEAIE
jgi:hypothetical protein